MRKQEQKDKAMLAPKDNNSTSISWLKLLLLALAVRIHKGRKGGREISESGRGCDGGQLHAGVLNDLTRNFGQLLFEEQPAASIKIPFQVSASL